MPTLEEKDAVLRGLIAELRGAVVALSGGVDSCLVAAVSADVLGERAVAITGVSDSLSEEERRGAAAFAATIRIRYEELHTHEIERPGYVANSPRRCFECKDELYALLATRAAAEAPGTVVLDGANRDDEGDYRPGREAARLHGVRSPLSEAGLHKADVRALARRRGLAVWDKPAMACLASRIPYGSAVTSPKLRMIARAEAAVRALGFRDVRVRHHGSVARLEVGLEEAPRLLAAAIRPQVVAGIKAAGFDYVALDLEGFRSGSMNEVLPMASLPAAHGPAAAGTDDPGLPATR